MDTNKIFIIPCIFLLIIPFALGTLPSTTQTCLWNTTSTLDDATFKGTNFNLSAKSYTTHGEDSSSMLLITYYDLISYSYYLKLWLSMDVFSGRSSNPVDWSPVTRTVWNHGATKNSTGKWGNSTYGGYMNITAFDNGLIYDYDTYISPATYNYDFTITGWGKVPTPQGSWVATKPVAFVSDWISAANGRVQKGWILGYGKYGNVSVGYGCVVTTGICGGMVYGNKVVANDAYHFMAFTLTGTKAYEIYVDGNLSGSGNFPTAMSYGTTRKFIVGGSATASITPPIGNFWNGNIEDVRVFARKLTPQEIRSLYSTKKYPLKTNHTLLTHATRGTFYYNDGLYFSQVYEINGTNTVGKTSEHVYAINSTSSCFRPNPGDSSGLGYVIDWILDYSDNCRYIDMPISVLKVKGYCSTAAGGNLTYESGMSAKSFNLTRKGTCRMLTRVPEGFGGITFHDS